MANEHFQILVVLNDAAKRAQFVQMLQQEGFEIEQATTGATALACVAARTDLIILGVQLPDISGLEVCRRLKHSPHTAHIPILQVSALYTDARHRIDGLKSGADACFTDAVQGPELIATAHALLRARQAERALRESEQRFKTLVQSIRAHAVFTCDPTGAITSWNEGVGRIFGRGPADFVGQNYHAVFGSAVDGTPELELASAQRCVEFERWIVRPDGKRFLGSGTLTAVFDDANECLGLISIVHDATEQKGVEEDRQRLFAAERAARDDAETANRLKDEFLATLSHELRTPLNAILGWTQLLKYGQDSREQVREAVAVIERNAYAQAQLIEDLLDISRIISGKLRLNQEPVALDGVVRAAVQSLQTAAVAKQLEIRQSLPEQPAVLVGDAGRLQQIVWNLLSNAIKFTPKGGCVHIQLQVLPHCLQVSIQDNGDGIAPDFLPYVFDRFRQADGTRHRPHGGLGLGLAIVKQLTELHGGTVQAESHGEARGATFSVSLPIPKSASTSAQLPTRRSDEVPRTTLLQGLRVLIVEDDLDGQRLLQRLVEEHGGVVTAVSNVQEALVVVQRQELDLVISDIGMPGEDGYSFLRKLRARENGSSWHLPAVALSAFASPDDRARSLAAGFEAHVSKPVRAEVLLEVLDAILAKSTDRPLGKSRVKG